jgi:hypothetical protein
MDVIKDTCRKVEQWLGQCANPVVLWSGGKDSTAMLHLIRYEVGANLPVIQWREPRFRSRYAFSDRLANAWDLEMYDYAPMDYMLTDGFDIETGAPRFDFVKFYQFGQKALALCLGTEEPKAEELASGRYLCGLDALRRPTGTFAFPWDAAFHGQKRPMWISSKAKCRSPWTPWCRPVCRRNFTRCAIGAMPMCGLT